MQTLCLRSQGCRQVLLADPAPKHLRQHTLHFWGAHFLQIYIKFCNKFLQIPRQVCNKFWHLRKMCCNKFATSSATSLQQVWAKCCNKLKRIKTTSLQQDLRIRAVWGYLGSARLHIFLDTSLVNRFPGVVKPRQNNINPGVLEPVKLVPLS